MLARNKQLQDYLRRADVAAALEMSKTLTWEDFSPIHAANAFNSPRGRGQLVPSRAGNPVCHESSGMEPLNQLAWFGTCKLWGASRPGGQ